jgi:hypothetical protein
MELVVHDVERLDEEVEDLLADSGRVFDVVHAGEEEEEFVAAEARTGVSSRRAAVIRAAVAGASFIPESLCHANDGTKHLSIVPITNASCRDRGERVGLENQVRSFEGTPTAHKAFAGCDEVQRPFVLTPPTTRLNSGSFLVDLYERTGLK